MKLNIISTYIQKYNDIVENLLKNTKNQLKNSNKLLIMIPIINFIKSNKLSLLLFSFVLIYLFSNQIIYFINLYLLFDSIIISLIILQNKSLHINSRRLAKNVILKSLLHFNFIGSTLTFLFVIFIYNEYNKFINRIIFKFVKLIVFIITRIFPFSNKLYTDAKLLNFDEYDKTMDSEEYYSTLKNKFIKSELNKSLGLSEKSPKIINSVPKYSSRSKKTKVNSSSNSSSLDEYATNKIIKSKDIKFILNKKNKKY